MLKKRIIPCLDIIQGRVTKGVAFKNNADIGDAAELSAYYSDHGADEIVIYDIMASAERRSPDFANIEKIAERSFIPICIGGGIRDFEDAARCIASGAEKVSLNSIAPQRPDLITEISNHFGVQALVLSVDAFRDSSCPSGYRLVIHGGRTPTEHDVLDWLSLAVPKGVGEICVNSIDQDGQRSGYDLHLLGLIKSQFRVPVIASGGAGSVEHVSEVLRSGADAALVASIVHSGEFSIYQIKNQLAADGIKVRLDW